MSSSSYAMRRPASGTPAVASKVARARNNWVHARLSSSAPIQISKLALIQEPGKMWSSGSGAIRRKASLAVTARMRAVTASEAFRLMAPEPLDHIFPGSWINANFDIWIGAEEDNQAWTQLLRARATYDATTGVPEASRRMAYEELLIAEGSDWCWWYGPEHDSANRPEFDQLYRSHLANVYRFLNLVPPEPV